jgi:hypothetical protein
MYEQNRRMSSANRANSTSASAGGNKFLQYSYSQAVIYPGMEVSLPLTRNTFSDTNGSTLWRKIFYYTSGNGAYYVDSAGDANSPVTGSC